MKRNWCSLRIPFFGGIATMLVLSSAPVLALPFVAQTTFGGASDEIGTGVDASGSGVYFTGIDGASSRGMIGQFSSALASPPIWSRLWAGPPTDPGQFRGVALTGTGVIAVGQSYYQTGQHRRGQGRQGHRRQVQCGWNFRGWRWRRRVDPTDSWCPWRFCLW